MLDTPKNQTSGIYTPEEIMAEVDEKGFCLAEFSDETKAILDASPIKEMKDGFHVDHPEHRRIFEQTSEIQSVWGTSKTALARKVFPGIKSLFAALLKAEVKKNTAPIWIVTFIQL